MHEDDNYCLVQEEKNTGLVIMSRTWVFQHNIQLLEAVINYIIWSCFWLLAEWCHVMMPGKTSLLFLAARSTRDSSTRVHQRGKSWWKLSGPSSMTVFARSLSWRRRSVLGMIAALWSLTRREWTLFHWTCWPRRALWRSAGPRGATWRGGSSALSCLNVSCFAQAGLRMPPFSWRKPFRLFLGILCGADWL